MHIQKACKRWKPPAIAQIYFSEKLKAGEKRNKLDVDRSGEKMQILPLNG